MKPLALAVTLAVAFAAGLAWAAGKPAMVRLKQEGMALEITFDNKQKLTVTSAKPVPLAEGQHNVKAVRLLKTDDKKRTWEMQGDGPLGSLETVIVEAEQDKVLDTGDPIIFDGFIWPDGKSTGNQKEVLLRVTTHGRYGENYYPGACLGGKRPPPPAWKLVASADGKVLAQGQFQAPKSGSVVEATTNIPKSFATKAKLELTPTMGPFDWKPASDEYDFKPH